MSGPSSPRSRFERPSFATIILLAMLAAAVLFGGASRADSLAQPAVRTAAVLALVALVAGPARLHANEMRPILWFLVAAALIAAVQLVPLPPDIWTLLPGRELYARSAGLAGISQPWRPVNLTPDGGWNALFSLVVPAAALTALMCADAAERRQLVLPLGAIAVASAALGVAQLATGPDGGLNWYAQASRRSPSGFFANRNHQALLLAIGLPVVTLLTVQWWEQRRAAGVLIAGIIANVFLLVTILVAGSRMGLLAAAIGLATAALLAWPVAAAALRGVSRGRRRAILASAAVAATALPILAFLAGRAISVTRLMDLDIASDARSGVLEPLWSMIRTYFPFGSGLGSFEAVYRAHEPFDQLRPAYMNQAHTDVLQLTLETGLPGVLLIAAALCWWLVRVWAIMRVGPLAPASRVGVLGASALLILALGSAFDYPLRTPLMMVIAVIAAAWLASSPARARVAGRTSLPR